MHQPSFDTWTSIFLLIATQGFFISGVLALNKRGDRKANVYIALIVLLFSLTMVEYVLYWTGYLKQFRCFMNMSITFPFLLGPLLLFYLRQLFLKKPFLLRDIAHLLPFLLEFIYWIPYYLSDKTVKFQLLGQPYILEILAWTKIIHMTIYGVICWRLIQQIAPLSIIRVWASRVVIFFFGYISTNIAYYTLIKFSFFNTDWDYMISFAMSAFIGLVALYGYVQPEIFSGASLTNFKDLVLNNGEKYKNSTLTPTAADVLLMRLNTLMENEKLYHDNDLRLEKLAEKLGAQRHHVSQIMNEKIGLNFFDYINSLRVEEAKRLLIETSKKEMNVIEIAYSVGFNNKVSFNNTFKKWTGMTPTEFRALEKGKTLSEFTD